MSIISTTDPCPMLRSDLQAAKDFYDNSLAQELADQIKARNADRNGYPRDASPWPVAIVQARINVLNVIVPSAPWIVAALGAYYKVLADLYNMKTAQAEIDAATAGLKANNC
jgi:hypothetical protein